MRAVTTTPPPAAVAAASASAAFACRSFCWWRGMSGAAIAAIAARASDELPFRRIPLPTIVVAAVVVVVIAFSRSWLPRKP